MRCVTYHATYGTLLHHLNSSAPSRKRADATHTVTGSPTPVSPIGASGQQIALESIKRDKQDVWNNVNLMNLMNEPERDDEDQLERMNLFT